MIPRRAILTATLVATTFPGVVAEAGGPEPERAFFILQTRHLHSDDWPEAFRRYRVFVCNPGFDERHLAAVRYGVPGAVCLAYTSLHDANIGLYPDSRYFRELTAAFPESLCIRETETGDLVCLSTTPRGMALPSYVMTKGSADALVEFHRTVTLKTSWDGFFLDVCNGEYPAIRKQRLARLGVPFDFDGDGNSDAIDDIDAVYEKWRGYFTARMRETVGDEGILLGNSGGPLRDPALNGITLEGVGEELDPGDARRWLEDQRAVATRPFLAILWPETERAVAPSLRLARRLDGVLLGTMAHVGLGD